MDFKIKTNIVSVDPSKRRTGGASLGDCTRMNAINNPRIYRSLATRQSNLALSVCKRCRTGIEGGQFRPDRTRNIRYSQSDTEILDHSDAALYVMNASTVTEHGWKK